MSVEGAISEWLRDDPGIADMAGTRVFPTGTIRQDLRPPWVSYQRLDTDYHQHLGNASDLAEVRLQINAVANTSTDARNLAEFVRLRMLDTRLRGQTIDGTKIEGVHMPLGTDSDSENPPVASRERATMAVILDFGVWHRVAVPA